MPAKKISAFKTVFSLATVIIFALFITFKTAKRAVYKITSDFFYPYLSIPSKVTGSLKDKSLLLKSKLALAAEVHELRKKNDELFTEILSRGKLERENNILRKMLKIRKRSGYKTVFSEVILRDPVFWEESFVINKGSEDGIREGAIVLAPLVENIRGITSALTVIGRIKSCSEHTAAVATLMSRECGISLSIPEKSAFGISSGGFKKNNHCVIRITYLPKNVNFRFNGLVYTSGMSETAPPGIYAGRLTGAAEDITLKNGLYREAAFIPGAGFENINFVVVMVKKKDSP